MKNPEHGTQNTERGDGMTGYLLVLAIVILAAMPMADALGASIAKLMDSSANVDNVKNP